LIAPLNYQPAVFFAKKDRQSHAAQAAPGQ
jgi:hypothetical protein